MAKSNVELPKKAEGLMHISSFFRTEYGATYAIFENEVGAKFMVPMQHLLELFRTLYGTRHTKLLEKTYYQSKNPNRQKRETYILDK